MVTPADGGAVRDRARPSEHRTTRTLARPSLAQLGLHPLSYTFIGIQAALVVVFLVLLPVVGLSVDWVTWLPLLAGDIAVAALWIYFVFVPGKPREWVLAETVLALVLLLVLSHILSPAQYVAVAFDRPLIDPFLARTDALMGVNVGALAEWTRAHPQINRVLALAYYTLLVQLAAVVPILGILLRDRHALWEYAFHFHFCAIVTVLSLALFPAACAFQFYGFESTLPQGRFIEQFNSLRAGTFTLIRYDNLEGLISMPSFHMAGALMVIWALRQRRWWLAPALTLNMLLIASTVLSGAHYVVDLIGTGVMFAASLCAWRIWGTKVFAEQEQHALAPVVREIT
jgi:hypothetical protein